MKLGKRQLHLLSGLGCPSMSLVVADTLSDSLCKRGLLKARRGNSMIGITPAGLRCLADALESGELQQFIDKRFRD